MPIFAFLGQPPRDPISAEHTGALVGIVAQYGIIFEVTIAGVPVENAYQSPPLVMDTNVLVAGACRHESSLAYQLLLGVLEQTFPIVLTEPIVLEYLDVLARPSVRALTSLTRCQSEELVADLISLSRKVQLRFSWRPNLRDERDNKFVEAAIHAAAVIVTYNVNDFRSPELGQHGWTVMTPQEFLARYQ